MNKDHRHDYEKSYEGSEETRRSCSPLSRNEDDTKMSLNDEVLVQESKYKCNTCGKTFGNGKALGGHRRSHFLKMKPNHHQSQQGKACYICEKKFPTKNALCGHMIKSHPDRVSKGVSSPSNHDIQKSSSSNSSNRSTQQNKEDNLSLPKWQNRGKRGRQCIGVVEAATTLLLLRSDKYLCTLSIDEQKCSEFPLPIKKRYCYVDESSSNGGNGDESENNDEEKASNDAAAEQNKLNFDLNESYLMEE